jgi:hypothetical protein
MSRDQSLSWPSVNRASTARLAPAGRERTTAMRKNCIGQADFLRLLECVPAEVFPGKTLARLNVSGRRPCPLIARKCFDARAARRSPEGFYSSAHIGYCRGDMEHGGLISNGAMT